MALKGLSSLGVKVGYALETEAGKKPSAFTLLTRISSVGDINLSPETIDASALEDYSSAYVEGRADTGGNCDIVINMTPDTIEEWEDAIAAYLGKGEGLEMWFTVWHPSMSKAFFFKAGLPAKLNMPGQEQNSLETFTASTIVHDYVGLDTAIEPA